VTIRQTLDGIESNTAAHRDGRVDLSHPAKIEGENSQGRRAAAAALTFGLGLGSALALGSTGALSSAQATQF
jgi:hypothetical protein